MADTNKRSVGGILGLVFILFFIFIGFAVYVLKSMGGNSDKTSGLKSDEVAIAVVEINGVISEPKEIIEKLHKAEKNDQYKAIILRVDSPGGSVGPVQEIYEEIVRIDKDKPIYTSFGAIAASGGYYVAAATRKIYANPGTLTGSIGVIMPFLDASKLMEFAKVSPQIIKSGRYKDLGQPHRALSVEEKNLMDGVLREVHQQFVRDIIDKRKDKIVGDIWEHAQGQIFSGEFAKAHGLVDELGGLWKAGREIHKELKLEGELKLKYIKKKEKESLWKLLRNVEEAVTNISTLATMPSLPMFLFKGAAL